MKFKIKKRTVPTKDKYHEKDIKIATDFSKAIFKELPDIIKSIVLFGSTAKHKDNKKSDVDILLLIDDVRTELTPELLETYKVMIDTHMLRISKRLHVVTLKLTTFWEYMRAGDPIAINILRDGFALIDCGIFDPLQALLFRGKIRPTQEAIHAYYSKAPATLHNSRWHILQATIDLYWATIDSAHAALMSQGYIPPSPSHVSEMLRKELVGKKLLEERYAKDMDSLYNIMKKITHREITHVSGQDYEDYHKKAKDFVDRMKKLMKEKW
jgi:uncharacterized protein (UPF0332 family)/predicted nucleotidyltransferase